MGSMRRSLPRLRSREATMTSKERRPVRGRPVASSRRALGATRIKRSRRPSFRAQKCGRCRWARRPRKTVAPKSRASLAQGGVLVLWYQRERVGDLAWRRLESPLREKSDFPSWKCRFRAPRSTSPRESAAGTAGSLPSKGRSPLTCAPRPTFPLRSPRSPAGCRLPLFEVGDPAQPEALRTVEAGDPEPEDILRCVVPARGARDRRLPGFEAQDFALRG